MKPAFFVFTVTKAAFDEKDGLLYGSNALSKGGTYQPQLYDTRETAEIAARRCANGGSVSCIFELTEAMLIKPTPVEIITVGTNDPS